MCKSVEMLTNVGCLDE